MHASDFQMACSTSGTNAMRHARHVISRGHPSLDLYCAIGPKSDAAYAAEGGG